MIPQELIPDELSLFLWLFMVKRAWFFILLILACIIITPTALLLILHRLGLLLQEIRIRRVIETAREETRNEPVPRPQQPQTAGGTAQPGPGSADGNGPLYFILVGQERQGPMSKARLRAKLGHGVITPQTHCREVDSMEWSSVGTIFSGEEVSVVPTQCSSCGVLMDPAEADKGTVCDECQRFAPK